MEDVEDFCLLTFSKVLYIRTLELKCTRELTFQSFLQELLDYVFNCVNDGLPDHQKSIKGNNP